MTNSEKIHQVSQRRVRFTKSQLLTLTQFRWESDNQPSLFNSLNNNFYFKSNSVKDIKINANISFSSAEIARICELFAEHELSDADEVMVTIEEIDELPPTMGNVGTMSEPPRLAEFIAGLFAKECYKDYLSQCLEECFERDVKSGMSERRARLRYWAAALRSVVPMAVAALKRIGVLGLIIDAARRMIG